MQAEVDTNRQRVEAEQQTLKIQHEAQLNALRMQMEGDFQRWKAELDAAVKIQVANIGSKAKLNDAATQAATAEIAQDVTQ
jgi:hypothetical protein